MAVVGEVFSVLSFIEVATLDCVKFTILLDFSNVPEDALVKWFDVVGGGQEKLIKDDDVMDELDVFTFLSYLNEIGFDVVVIILAVLLKALDKLILFKGDSPFDGAYVVCLLEKIIYELDKDFSGYMVAVNDGVEMGYIRLGALAVEDDIGAVVLLSGLVTI